MEKKDLNKGVIQSIALFQVILMISLQIAIPALVANSFDTKEDKNSKNVFQLLKELLFSFMPNVQAQDLTELYCCEQTTEGSTCQETTQERCDGNFDSHVLATGENCEDVLDACVLGSCESEEGDCMDDISRKVCEEAEGDFHEGQDCDNVGLSKVCCVIGNQYVFETETRCNELARNYGIPIEYVKVEEGITNEASCLALSSESRVGRVGGEGCCVTESSFVFTTGNDCDTRGGEFHAGMLCSHADMNSPCEEQVSTGCVQGRDEVYWFDSCNNRENIYDTDKDRSWNNGYVLSKEDSCNSDTANINNINCGNCDFFKGSLCREAGDVKPREGNYICRDLNCKNTLESDGSLGERKNGEVWCVYDYTPEEGKAPVGSRHWVASCIDGEQVIEGCADLREEVCVQGELKSGDETFSQAACIPNNWQQCLNINDNDKELEDKKEECEETDGCFWFNAPTTTEKKASGHLGGEKLEITKPYPGFEDNSTLCLPKTPHGIDLTQFISETQEETDENIGEAYVDADTCSRGTYICNVIKKKTQAVGITYKTSTINGECLTDDGKVNPTWAQAMNERCMALGDCGANININKEETDEGYFIYKGVEIDEETDLDTWRDDPDTKRYYLSGSYINSLKDMFVLPLKREVIKTTGAGDIVRITGGLLKDFTGFITGMSESMSDVGQETSDVPVTDAEGDGDGGETPSAPQKEQDKWKIFSYGWPGDSGEELKKLTVTESNRLGNLLGKFKGGEKLTTTEIKDSINLLENKLKNEGLTGEEANTLLDLKGKAGVESVGMFDKLISPSEHDYQLQSFAAYALISKTLGVDTKTSVIVSAAYSFVPAVQNFVKGIVEKVIGKVTGTAGFVGIALTLTLIGLALMNLGNLWGTKVKVTSVVFSCQPALPPEGGEDCKLCNADELRPCTEYRCASLGTACGLVNPGSEEQICEAVRKDDGSIPRITDVEVKPPHEISDFVEDKRVRIEQDGNCVDAFDEIKLKLTTSEATQCKIDFRMPQGNTKDKYESMALPYGGINFYMMEHTQIIPTGITVDTEDMNIQLGSENRLYVMCKDIYGHVNPNIFTISFCVDTSPDLEAPRIVDVVPKSGTSLPFNTESQHISAFTNEPADCKWNKTDMSYDEMPNEFACENGILDKTPRGWLCEDDLTGFVEGENKFYFRCKDKPYVTDQTKRNVNSQSYVYTLNIGKELVITSVLKPANGTEIKAGAIAKIDLEVKTAEGADNGKATCYYSLTGFDREGTVFETTGGTTHKKDDIMVGRGKNTFYISCVDSAGNQARAKTQIIVETDEKAPIIIRVYTEAGSLVIVTDELTSCRYSEDRVFVFEDGTIIEPNNSQEHSMPIPESEMVYVKCRDEYDNEISRTIKPSPIS